MRFPLSISGNRSLTAGPRGFTFLEVLFAIMVLGIGFILVAAMFPAAIKQTQATVDETANSGVWIGMHRKLLEVAKNPAKPLPLPTGVVAPPPPYVFDQNMRPIPAITPVVTPTTPDQAQVLSFFDARISNAGPTNFRYQLWSAVAANIIVDSDPRYACIPFYKRDGLAPGSPVTVPPTIGANSATVYLFSIRSKNKPLFESKDLAGPVAANNSPMANLNPTLMRVKVNPQGALDAPFIQFISIYDRNRTINGVNPKPTPLTVSDEDTPLAPGAYVIISSSPQIRIPGTAPQQFYSPNGQIYRLGSRVNPSDATQYYIAPDPQGATDVYDGSFTAYPTAGGTTTAFVIGRGISTSGATTFDGPSQAIGVIPISIPLSR